MKKRWIYLTVAAWLLAGCCNAAAQTSGHTFHIFFRGAQLGSEEVTLLQLEDGWALRGSGRIGAPINLITEYWEARYDPTWKPVELTLNQFDGGTNRWSVHTTFSAGAAVSDVNKDGQNQRTNQTIQAGSIVLPNMVFGSYEALAARLASTAAGDTLPLFIAPQTPMTASVVRVADEKIQLPGSAIDARHWTLNVGNPSGTVNLDVWTQGPRLLRIDIPTQMLTVIRDDISTVGARIVTMSRANDEQVTIPANGFSLAATISKPAEVGTRLPVVVLISSTSSLDRDEIVGGIPVFAQLAGGLADAGFLVVRYDRRGVGQSGGRPESATYEDFAADGRAVLAYLQKRRDVDPKKIAVAGFGDGGWVAMTTAARDSHVSALILLNTPSVPGTELVLEQQKQALDAAATEGAARDKAIEQQKAILDAVVTGKGWDALSPDIRRRVDNPSYRSFLTFDPAAILSKTRQPLLVLHGAIDKEVPIFHGEQLAQLGRSRVKAQPTAYVALAGLNHLLARATTGQPAEYGTLAERTVSPAALLELNSWLKGAFAPPETSK